MHGWPAEHACQVVRVTWPESDGSVTGLLQWCWMTPPTSTGPHTSGPHGPALRRGPQAPTRCSTTVRHLEGKTCVQASPCWRGGAAEAWLPACGPPPHTACSWAPSPLRAAQLSCPALAWPVPECHWPACLVGGSVKTRHTRACNELYKHRQCAARRCGLRGARQAARQRSKHSHLVSTAKYSERAVSLQQTAAAGPQLSQP